MMNNYHLSDRGRALTNALERRGVTGFPVTYEAGGPHGPGWMIWIGKTPQMLGGNTVQAGEFIRSGNLDFLGQPGILG